ncbi:MAG: adenosine kinase [Miltoncostaeaceae bacterium]
MNQPAPSIDVLGIGNAIVDVLVHAEDSFVEGHGLAKGAMTLVDQDQAAALYGGLGSGVEVSGGSCANTVVGLAQLGARSAYIGKVRDDQLGEIFAHDIRAAGVRYATPPATEGPTTARCLVMVAPDAQRTMATYLGVSVELGPDDVDPDLVSDARILYLEGYLWDPPQAKEAFRAAMATAKGSGRTVALTLSDPFCVERHRDEFVELVDGDVDVLFANEQEILSLTQAATFDDAVEAIRGRPAIAAITRSEQGSVVVTSDATHAVPASPVAEVVDTTGAGDLYAAGFLYGLATERDLPTCARLGGIAAAEIIGHVGARPEADLAGLVEAAGLAVPAR